MQCVCVCVCVRAGGHSRLQLSSSALVAQARENQVSIHKDYLQPAEKCKRNLEGLTVDP